MTSKRETLQTSTRKQAKPGGLNSSGTTAVPWPFPPFPLPPHQPPTDRALLGAGRSTMNELMTDVGPSPF